jgi:phosphatidylinositol alpha-1,6-mannosyltransferase
MRLLLLTPVFPPARGGIETLAGQLASHLEGPVLVVALAPGPQAAVSVSARPDGPGVEVIRVANDPMGGRRSILLLNARALAAGARFRPDLVLSMHVKASPAGRTISRLRRVPFVQYVHAKEMREVPALARFAVEGADAVVAVSRYSRDLAVEAGADPARVTILPNGVEPAGPPIAPRDTVPTMVTVSRLEDRYKGHDVVLAALPSIRAAIPAVRWVVIGDGALRPELERAARDAGLADVVEFAGGVDDATRDAWLDRASLFVMPSRQPPGNRAGEGFGIVFLEANAHGLPVVGGRVPGVVDAVVDGETGLLTDPTDPEAVAAAAIRILSDDDLARRLGDAGAARARELTWANVSARLQRLLDALVAAGPARRGEGRASFGWRWARDLLVSPAPPDA